jgi:hypothetical protein
MPLNSSLADLPLRMTNAVHMFSTTVLYSLLYIHCLEVLKLNEEKSH